MGGAEALGAVHRRELRAAPRHRGHGGRGEVAAALRAEKLSSRTVAKSTRFDPGTVEAAKPMDATLPSRGFPMPDARDWSPTNLKAAALRGASKSKSSASLYTTFEEIDEYDRLQKKAVRELMRRKVGRMQKEEALNPVPPTFSAKTAKSFLSDPPSFLLSDDAQQSRRLS